MERVIERLSLQEGGGRDRQINKNEIIIKLQDQLNKERHFLIKRDVPIRETLLSFCRCEDLHYRSMRFLFDGAKVKEFQTPADIGMENGDIIDAFFDQSGGGSSGHGH